MLDAEFFLLFLRRLKRAIFYTFSLHFKQAVSVSGLSFFEALNDEAPGKWRYRITVSLLIKKL
jgi:hypothetical protein